MNTNPETGQNSANPVPEIAPNQLNPNYPHDPAQQNAAGFQNQQPAIAPNQLNPNYPHDPAQQNAAGFQNQPQQAPAFQQNPAFGYANPQQMQNNAFQQNPNGGFPYQPQMPYNGYPQNPAGGYPYPAQMPYGGYPQNQMGGYPAYQPQPLDPRYQQFQTSTLQPGQREIVRCSEVSKIYSGSTQALSPLNLVIGNGRVIGLLGPNGSGKTTLIKLICGLLTPTTGSITVNGVPIGPQTKAMVSYLPDRTYIPEWMKIKEILDYFCDFYTDFRRPLAETMLGNLRINPDAVMKTLSKGTQEKVQLILVMSRNASLYLLDEPIAGVDPVARDYILDTIIRAHNPDSSVLISTHLINDIEPVLNEVIMIKYGTLAVQGDANELRKTFGKSLNDIFKEVFAGC